MKGHIAASRRTFLHASLIAFAICAVSTAIAQKHMATTSIDGHSIDAIGLALKKGETKTVIKNSLGSNIYINTVTVSENDQRAPLTLVWVVFPHNLVTLRACHVNKIGPANLLYQNYSPKGALALVNGGFYGFNSDNRQIPLGLLISDGKRLSPAKPWTSGGILLVREQSEIDIVPISQKDRIGNPNQALQSKPLLIENGTLAVKLGQRDAPFNRSAIGLTEKGDIVIAGAFRDDTQAVTLYDFAKFLMLLRTLKTVNIKVALNLDGATDSHFYVVPSAIHFGYEGSNYVPNVLAILPR